jgi:hypothetical protein
MVVTPRITNPFTLTAPETAALLNEERTLIPELDAYRSNPAALAALPAMQVVLAQTEPLLAGIENIPHTGYTPYRFFIKNGDRKAFETPYFLKRRAMAALALRAYPPCPIPACFPPPFRFKGG